MHAFLRDLPKGLASQDVTARLETLGPHLPSKDQIDGRAWHALCAALALGPAPLRAALAAPDVLCRWLTQPRTQMPARPWAYLRLAWQASRRARLSCHHTADAAVFKTHLYNELLHAKEGQWLRIVALAAARQISSADAGLQLSYLAEAIVRAAWATLLAHAQATALNRPPQPLMVAVLAQGKLGSFELNVSSDLDVQFLSQTTSDAAKAEDAGRAQKMAQDLLAVMGASWGARPIYRMDTTLRPEGTRGALVTSLAYAVCYYQERSRPWERLALVRARHVAGAPSVSREFLLRLKPLIWPRVAWAPGAATPLPRAETPAGHLLLVDDLKRAPGGIRDIELFVHALQARLAANEPSLGPQPTGSALTILSGLGLLPRGQGQTLRRHYSFLRRLENALQTRHDQQCYGVPTDVRERDALAQAVGISSAMALGTRLRRVARDVQRHIGAQAAPHRARGDSKTQRALKQALGHHAPKALAALQTLNFLRPHEALVSLRILRAMVKPEMADAHAEGDPSLGVTFGAKQSATFCAYAWLKACNQSADADQALRLAVGVDAYFRRCPSIYRFLAEAPQVHQHIAELLGASVLLAGMALHQPRLLNAFFVWPQSKPVSMRRLNVPCVSSKMAVLPKQDAAKQHEEAVHRLRAWHKHSVFTVGVREMAGHSDVAQTRRDLARIAKLCVEAACRLAHNTRLDGRRSSPGFCVLALGGLGAGSMHYASDLDLMFVYEAPCDASSAQHLAQAINSVLSAHAFGLPMFAVDTRLRPWGDSQPLATHAQALSDYHRHSARPWEHLALSVARPIAGDVRLGAKILRVLDENRYGPKTFSQLCHARDELVTLRHKMRAETRPLTLGLDIKQARGGITDLAQSLQFVRWAAAHRYHALRRTMASVWPTLFRGAAPMAREQVQKGFGAWSCLRQLELVMSRMGPTELRFVVEPDEQHAHALARQLGHKRTAQLWPNLKGALKNGMRCTEHLLADASLKAWSTKS